MKIKVEAEDSSSQEAEEVVEKAPSPKKAKKDDASGEADVDVVDEETSEDIPASKEKENKKPEKPGEKVKKPRANIPCPRCGKMHRNEDHLEKHIMVVHEGIKPYLCDICGYGTNLRVKMDLHMATKHNEDKILSYVCEVCDYKCSNQLHLRAHLQIVHLEGLTPFECGVCQYQCRKRASVVKHMKIVHEKRRPFQCQHCDKSFPVNSVLLRHVESVHEKVSH